MLGVPGEQPAGPQPNEQYGDYEVIKPLASGGMADIFLARKLGAQGFAKLVVVKRIRREYIKDEHLINMFIDEAHVAAKLDHPNVVVVSDLGEIDDSYFMAMEYLRGQTLRNLDKRVAEYGQLLPYQLWARIMEYALDGLHYAHELTNDDGTLMGLVHRDFTPSNIMITYKGTVKVIDFGVARVDGPTRHETRIGTLKGKIAYMSPEQCRGTTLVDRRTDVFAAGIVLWELLSGKQLFDGPTDTAILVEIIQGTIPQPTWGGQPVDPGLAAIVMKSLEREPEMRYQSAAQMRDALREWLRTQPNRIDASDIANVMGQYFDAEKRADDNLIGKGDPTSARPMPGLRRGEGSVSRTGVSRPSRPSSARGQQQPVAGAEPPPRRRAPFIILGMLAVLAVAGGVWKVMQKPVVAQPEIHNNPPKEPPKGETVAPKGETVAGKGETPPTGETKPAVGETKPTGETVAGKGETAPTGETKPAVGETKPNGETKPAVAETKPEEKKHKDKDKKDSSPSVASGSGSLDFDTRPFTNVYIGKKKIGETPLLGVKVPAGKLTLTLINDEAGIKETYTIDIPKDGHVSKKLKF